MKKLTTTFKTRMQTMLTAVSILVAASASAQFPGGPGHHPGNNGGPGHQAFCNAHFGFMPDSVVNGIRFHNSANPTATYAWDFGDGSTSTLSDPSYTYATEGTYYVCLTVSDTSHGGCTDTWCDSVHVFTPPPHCNAHFIGWRDSVDLGMRFNAFHNSSTATYAWDFGDGSNSTDENPFHVYATGGTYYVCLTVENTNSAGTCTDTYCDSVHVFVPVPHCNARFFSFRDTITNGRRFIAAHNSPGATYAWDFGDGSTSSDENPAYAYADTGMYYVCLTVSNTNSAGSCTDTYCDSIHVFTPAPHCNAHFRVNSDSIANEVNFHAVQNSYGTTYAWDFGDGNTSTDQHPSNLYSAAGIYYVCLTVTRSNAGGSCTETFCDSIDTENLHPPHGPGHGHHGHGHGPFRLSESGADGTVGTVTASVFPNPMTDMSVIRIANAASIVSVRIIDSNGRVAFERNADNGDLNISKQDLSEGLYFYSVTQGDVQVAKGKLIVQ